MIRDVPAKVTVRVTKPVSVTVIGNVSGFNTIDVTELRYRPRYRNPYRYPLSAMTNFDITTNSRYRKSNGFSTYP